MSKKSKRILALLNDPKHRGRLLESLNRDTMDDGAPVSGQAGEMKVLQEMNELEDEHEQHIQELGPKPTIH